VDLLSFPDDSDNSLFVAFKKKIAATGGAK
jgi:hypothetical protein